MNWTQSLQTVLDYIEEHLEDEIDMEKLASEVGLSPFYFQKGFSLLCSISPGEYIRKRRLARAGLEVLTSEQKIIDLALKYGYESADSFSRAFTRFHGATPMQIRNKSKPVRSFDPLHIELIVKGGKSMEYRLEDKEPLHLVGVSRDYPYSQSNEVTGFWNELKQDPENRIMGWLGISYDATKGGETFEYTIADPYDPEKLTGSAHELTIPAFTWAIFPVRGPFTPEAYLRHNERIFNEWIPNHPYQIAEGYNVEAYANPMDYPMGMMDPDYLFEIWIPVKKANEG